MDENPSRFHKKISNLLLFTKGKEIQFSFANANKEEKILMLLINFYIVYLK